jgi:hypothetical protein
MSRITTEKEVVLGMRAKERGLEFPWELPQLREAFIDEK